MTLTNARTFGKGMLGLAAVAATTFVTPAAAAADRPGPAAAGLLQLLALLVLMAAIGFGLGAFGLTVSQLVRRRADLSFAVLKRRPRLALLVGVLVTVLGLGLLAILRGAPALQLLVLVAYLAGLALVGLASAARLAAEHLEGVVADGLPSPRAFVRGSMLLVGVNAVPVLGSALFLGILLAAIGATLLGYFVAFGKEK